MKTRAFDFRGRSLRSQFSAAKRREDLAKIITYAYYGKHISDLPSPATLAANIECHRSL